MSDIGGVGFLNNFRTDAEPHLHSYIDQIIQQLISKPITPSPSSSLHTNGWNSMFDDFADPSKSFTSFSEVRTFIANDDIHLRVSSNISQSSIEIPESYIATQDGKNLTFFSNLNY